jgi:glutaminyl-peptide cyclotransferase
MRRLAPLAVLCMAGCDWMSSPPPEPRVPAASVSVSPLDARPELVVAPFSGEQAFSTLRSVLELPRHYGAPERAKTIASLEKRLAASTDSVVKQSFEVTESASGVRYSLTNLIGRQHPEAKRRVLVGSHWDSRLWAEQDPDPSRREKPIAGANDGGSGVAVLLELAPLTRDFRSIGIDYVLFDGEEFGRPRSSEYCQGSRYLASHLAEVYPNGPPSAVLVLDMVGDADQEFFYEISSFRSAPSLVREVWGAAKSLGFKQFREAPRFQITDDHSPFLELGIPAMLLIDYDYPHWHTHADTIDKVSADSLGRVGAVLLDVLAAREKRGG